jgi:hypothetical protein
LPWKHLNQAISKNTQNDIKGTLHNSLTLQNAIIRVKQLITNLKIYMIMNIEQIENAILKLSEQDFTKLRNWLLDLDYQQWDKKLEQDIIDGKLDALAKEALAEFEVGDYQEI